MEARLELLEEVQNEADGEEAEEEGLWVRACSPFSDEPIGVGNLTSKHGGVLDSVSLEVPFFLLKILSKYATEVGFSCLPRSIWTARRQIFGAGHGVREHLRCLKPEGLLSHFYLFPWAPESRTQAYCLALIQRRK